MTTQTIETVEQARQAMLDMLANNSREDVRGWVMAAINATDADIDHAGDVWAVVAGHRHWVRDDALVNLVNTINRGV